jgi:hypothetical protein
MKPEFVTYVRDLGMGDTFLGRITAIHEVGTRLFSLKEFDDIFVSDHAPRSQTRTYVNLQFFTRDTVVKVENFVTQPTFDIQGLDKVAKCPLTLYDYDLVTLKEDSALHAFPTWEPIPFSLQLLAYRGNCPQLVSILKKYFFTRLIR